MPSEPPDLRFFRPDQPAVALGLAVNYLKSKPAFAALRFGEWSRILVGQINRGHYGFVVDDRRQVVGFVGWALATRETAEAWVEGRPLSYKESLAGECMIFNAWSADTRQVHRFLVDAARQFGRDKAVLYFMRHYPDGTKRPGRIVVNGFVSNHIGRRDAAASATGSGNGAPAIPGGSSES